MKIQKIRKLLFILSALSLLLLTNPLNAQDKLIEIMSSELDRNMQALKGEAVPPYFMSYRINELTKINISASFGDLEESDETKNRILTTELRVGSPELDNTHELREQMGFSLGGGMVPKYIPIDNNEDAIKQLLWKQTNKEYVEALKKFEAVKANKASKVAEEDKSADFSTEKASEYYEEPVKVKFDQKSWEDKLRKYSAPFLDEPSIFSGSASLTFVTDRKYFTNSEGTKIVENLTYARLFIFGIIKADDGMVMPLYKGYMAYLPENLPDDAQIMADINDIISKLKELKNAPIVEPYSGPALLSGEASGVFFHEIFGHRIEGKRMKSESDGQTFKQKVGEAVLPEHLSVIMDPNLMEYEGQDLIGSYDYDDEGIEGKRIEVIKDGILKEFLMSRCPIEGFPKSNGHGRAEAGKQTVTRQSNLIIETNNPKSMEELRKDLINEAKNQGLEYAYLFKKVTGGFTLTGRMIPGSFNVMPTEVYRIYVDGRPDELVRGVDLVGTPLAMFSQIASAGDSPKIFTGMCGAESGSVPVTCISPAIFVKRIEMQKKAKSQERPPLLPRPGAKPDKD